jgi:signal transduction histidine kinase
MAAQMGLEDLASDHPVRENLQDVVSEVDKLEAQVRGILDFARPFEPTLEPVDLSALVDALVTTLRPPLDAAGVGVEVKRDAGLPEAAADPAHLGQALQALVVNAIEAMPGGGRVTIALCASPRLPGGARITVEDTGRVPRTCASDLHAVHDDEADGDGRDRQW